MYVGGGHPFPRSRLFLSISFLPWGRGWLWKRQGEGGVGISGSWEPEKETESMTGRAFERAAGLCDLAQVPFVGQSPCLGQDFQALSILENCEGAKSDVPKYLADT